MLLGRCAIMTRFGMGQAERAKRRRCTAHESVVLFFFSSRRRHTRFDCDWSSDVCSSDLRLDPCASCRYAGLTWSPDGRRLAFISSDSAKGEAQLAVVRGTQLTVLARIDRKSVV